MSMRACHTSFTQTSKTCMTRVQDYLRREGIPAEELLPTPLKLRKEIERLTGEVQDPRSEQEVREVVKELNRRITEWPDGCGITLCAHDDVWPCPV
jgi:hypothetical protein